MTCLLVANDIPSPIVMEPYHHHQQPCPFQQQGADEADGEAEIDDLEVLVRFQDKTHVLRIPRVVCNDTGAPQPNTSRQQQQQQQQWLLSLWADRTGWPLSSLRVSSWQLPFLQIVVQSSVLGGKGGFGTLLKGQSRQAGAKLTTDFGACRDLQGRRLRHVNDEIKLRKWRDMEKQRQNGDKVEADGLWKTPSGIYNWHLMTPTWADISKKATYRIKRQFQKMDKEAEKLALKKQEQEQAYQNSMTHYLDQTNEAVKSIQQGLPDAIQQGLLAAAASSKKRKRTIMPTAMTMQSMDQQQPNSLCTISGDVVIVPQKMSVQLQSKSQFGTAVLVLDRSAPKLYYEVTIVSGGLAQIGWACLVGGGGDGNDDDVDNSIFSPNNELGDGVGDDVASFAVDGSRGLKFHAGKEESYALTWKKGDRVGCLLDSATGSISFLLNGKDCGTAFTTNANATTATATTKEQRMLVPAFSCNQGEILELHTKQEDCRHFPKEAVAVGDLVEVPSTTDPKYASEESNTGNDTKPPAIVTKKEPTINKSAEMKQHATKPAAKEPPKEPVKPELLELEPFQSTNALEALGLDRLKSALMALRVKCGGTLAERAVRLFSLKGLERKDYPKKVRAKGFIE